MSQEILTSNGSKKQTELDKLLLIRIKLYKDIYNKLQVLKIRKRDLIQSYKYDIKQLDERINYLKSKDIKNRTTTSGEV